MFWHAISEKELAVRFKEPWKSFSAISQFQITLKTDEDWDGPTLRFLKAKYGLEISNSEILGALFNREKIAPLIAAKIIKAFPEADYEFVFDAKYNVAFTQPQILKDVLSKFIPQNSTNESERTQYEGFAKNVFRYWLSSITLERLLKGEFISRGAAEHVLKAFPDLTFELKKVRVGPPKKISSFDDLKNNELKFGIVQSGYSVFDLEDVLKKALLSAGIQTNEARGIELGDVEKVSNQDLTFIANAWLTPTKFPDWHLICNTYSLRIYTFYSKQFMRLRIKRRREANLRIGVIQGSPEETLGEALGIPDLIRIAGIMSTYRYDFLLKMLEEGRLDAILINGMAVKTLLYWRFAHKYSKETMFSQIYPLKNDELHELFDRQHASPKVAKQISSTSLTMNLYNGRQSYSLAENKFVIVEPQSFTWRVKLGIYAKEPSKKLPAIIRSQFPNENFIPFGA